MQCCTSCGGGGTNAALPGRVPPIQFCDCRNSPGVFCALRPVARRISCISRNSRLDNGKPPRSRCRPCDYARSEEHTSELQSHLNLVCRLLLEKKKKNKQL